jgi:pSer/pThr/pTyr-binding forkhead associated (FHA) protein
MPIEPHQGPISPEMILQIDRLCDQFESDVQAGRHPALERLLPEVNEEALPQLFRELLDLEMNYRREAGQPLTAEEAGQRFAGLGSWAPEILADFELNASESALLLEVLEGPVAGQNYRLTGHATFFVGRGASANLPLVGDNTLSRTHFCIEYNPPQAQLIDTRSKNGTFHNGVRLDPPGARVDLRDGDLIGAGDLVIRVRLLGDEPTVTRDPAHKRAIPDPWVTTPPAAEPPVIPGYTIEEEVGRGGMGVVYRARRQMTNATVAIKTILPALTPRSDTLARFQREVKILERLNHPNIVRFHEAGIARDLVFFVMEFIPGASAGRMVKQHGPFPLPRVVQLGCELLEALAHAHDRGFVHRDVKPGNMLLNGAPGSETLKLADFGLARAYEASAMSGLTMSGQSGGTPAFMPPEQVRSFRAAQPSADQYSAAASLYYLATGQHIYEKANSMMDLLTHILQEEPIPLRPGPPHPALAGMLGGVIRRALARQPDDRFPDVRAMQAALRAVVE